jgi:hypothetical protein
MAQQQAAAGPFAPAPWIPPPPPVPDLAAAASGAAPSPAEEIASLQPLIKSRREFLKQILVITTANPQDAFYARMHSDTTAEISQMAARLEALRPPEARLAGVLGALNNKKKVLAKAVADLAAVDSQRLLTAQWVEDVTQEVAVLETQYNSLTTAPAVEPAPASMQALEVLLAGMGASSVLETLKGLLTSIGVAVDVEMPPVQAHSATPPPPSPFAAPGAQEAAAALAASSQHLFYGTQLPVPPADLTAAPAAAAPAAPPLTELGRATSSP